VKIDEGRRIGEWTITLTEEEVSRRGGVEKRRCREKERSGGD